MIDVLIGFFIATLITQAFTTRLFRLIFWYSINSLFLGLIAIYEGYSINDNEMKLIGIITLIVKFILIPYVLKYYFIKFKIKRNIIPITSIQYLVIIIPIILVFTLYLITPLIENFAYNSNYIAISISALMISLLLMIEHKNIAAKLIGFLDIENALFLLGISATEGMPMLIELGIFLDLLMLIIILNLLFENQGAK